MTFDEFWVSNEVNTLWIVSVGSPAGIKLSHTVDTDCDEDYCDLSELVNEEQFDWLGDLEGEVIDGQWCWNGEGAPRYMTNSVTNVKAY